MNITTHTVLRHFLLHLRTECNDPKVVHIDPFFRTFFTKGELEDIVCSLFDTPTLDKLNPRGMSKEELLDTIGDDALILGYYIDRWDDERERNASWEQDSVLETLEQLGLETHYLGQKAIEDWDGYDYANYRALQLKAGKLMRIYGIYDAGIAQEEAEQVTSPPNRFYESRELAETAMRELITERNISPDELHILSLYAGR